MVIVPPLTQAARLHGRDREQSHLADLLRRARTGESSAVLVTGEAGIGKTALLAALRATAEGFAVLQARGVQSEAGLAFAGLHRLLLPVADRLPLLPEQQRLALAAALELGDTPVHGRFLLSVAVLGLLSEAARDRPVLVCVDDVHRLDGPSLEALAFAARRLGAGRMVVAIATGEGCEDGDGALAGVERLRLEGLGADAIAAVLADRSPVPIGDSTRSALVAAACGNPLAAVELADSLTPGQLVGAEPLPQPLPPGGELWASYARRISALPEPTRRLLLIIAVEEDMDTATLVLAAEQAQIPLSALDAAEACRLVRADADRIAFRHPLVRSASYYGAGLGERRAAHLLLAGVFDAGRQPLRRAWHRAVTAVRPDPELADELAQAATTARTGSGYAASAVLFERSADLTPDPPVRADRLGEAARDAWLAGQPVRSRRLLDRVRELGTDSGGRGRAESLGGEITLRSGIAVHAHETLLDAAHRLLPGHRTRALHAFVQAGEASCLAGDHSRYFATAARVAALRGPEERAEARIAFDYLAGKSAMFQGHYAQGRDHLERVLSDAERLNEPVQLIWGASAGLLLGDDVRSHALASRAVGLARRAGAVSVIPQAIEILSYSEFWTGRQPLVAANALEGVRLAEATGQENCASHHFAALALIAAVRGDAATCRAHARESARVAEAHDLGLPAALGAWALAFLELASGRAAEAASRLTSLAGAGPGRGHRAVRLLSAPHFVEAAVGVGNHNRARAALSAYQRWAEATGRDGPRALAARCRGLLSAPEEAEEHFTEALRLHRGGYRDFEQARTELLFAQLLRRRRRPRLAREHLHGALDTFERLDVGVWAERARAELRATGESVRAALPTALDELSPQQLRIARLVAEGATNREAATQLFLSPRTVDHHLRNVFSRLGIRSRVELARLLG
nr:LuxR family transcriptional regulator [Nocardiopsis ansamitocini]